MQQVLVYIFVGLAALFLIKKYIFKSKSKSNCGDGDDCKCG
jgi:uncharacterized membrane protein YuzA (DUF378 family)